MRHRRAFALAAWDFSLLHLMDFVSLGVLELIYLYLRSYLHGLLFFLCGCHRIYMVNRFFLQLSFISQRLFGYASHSPCYHRSTFASCMLGR